ncbi:hypothetical protein Dform_02009 [Dehalogenimonas formicexedens]|uniref:Uncharacterized protein n=2 Tax=Dehalogenimonas TaxID=670486 RepID=A0A1P8FA37_9CHLR|nr:MULTISPECIES: hypothetical protein [Dehalogenimonas]APV45322.1 hypothetical protein Dform_02009 [Dehalogenimonas formicexedens]KTB49127.1 hypothetical protein DEALK_00390 [Dehalogenimonas alkenigignens]
MASMPQDVVDRVQNPSLPKMVAFQALKEAMIVNIAGVGTVRVDTVLSQAVCL